MIRLEHSYPVIKYILYPIIYCIYYKTLSRSHSNAASYEVLKGFLKLINGKWDTFVKFQSILGFRWYKAFWLWLNFGEFTNFFSGIWDTFQNI